MVEYKVDKLGRRIPEFDRSAAAKKAVETRKQKDPKAYEKMGRKGGKLSTRGYFGQLKDEGRMDELRTISKKRKNRLDG